MWGSADVGSFLLDDEGYFRGNLVMKDEPEPPKFGSDSVRESSIASAGQIDQELAAEEAA